MNGEHVEPEKEVAAEVPLRHSLRQLPVRSGNNAHIDPPRPRTPDWFELAFLQDPQKLHLQWQGQLADLVEEDRPSIRERKASLTPLGCSGEGSLLVPKELTLNESLRQGSAIDLYKRALSPGAGSVQSARHEFLARTSLAEDQDSDVRSGHLVDILQHALQRLAVSEDRARALQRCKLRAQRCGLVDEGLEPLITLLERRLGPEPP